MAPAFRVHGESTKFGGRIGRTGARDCPALNPIGPLGVSRGIVRGGSGKSSCNIESEITDAVLYERVTADRSKGSVKT